MLRIWELPLLVLGCAVPWFALRTASHVPRRRAVTEALFAGYLGTLLYVVFFLPLAIKPDSRSVWESINLVPTRTVVGIYEEFRWLVPSQLIGNVILFLPLGCLLPALSLRFRRLVMTLAAGLAASVGVEVVQLVMVLTLGVRRAVDIDDVILNVIGACLGYLAWKSTSRERRPERSRH